MTDSSKSLSIIAYYLSEYDLNAVLELGYRNRTEAFNQISLIFNRKSTYLKLRRDEFDALPDSSSKRNGWKNRPAAKDVIELSQYLKHFSFDQLTEIVKALIDNKHYLSETNTTKTYTQESILQKASEQLINYEDDIPEEVIEQLINYKDNSSSIKPVLSKTNKRIYNHNIIKQLKLLYKGKCQICGSKPFKNEDICEIHHIEYFSISHNNDSSNLILLCPNHHRLIHKLNMKYIKDKKMFISDNGTKKLLITLNYHL